MPERESDLAARVMRWLQIQGWDCYPEVCFQSGAPRADIVGLRDGITYAVETKTTFGLGAIAQAEHWSHYADYTSVAVPGGRHNPLATTICRQYGLGVITIGGDPSDQWSSGWHLDPEPRLHRHRAHVRKLLLDRLDPDCKRYAPGNADCRYHSPWRGTCERLAKLVQERPGLTLKEMTEDLKHHYGSDATARSSLLHWCRVGKVPGVRVEEGRPLRLFPEDDDE